LKAYLLKDIGEFFFEDVGDLVPEKSEVVVSVKATGICGSDISRIYKSGTYSYPLIPGHEFSGIVTEIGEGVEKDWIGKRVGIFPLIPCQECKPCIQKKYEMCRNYNYLGSRKDGGFAEKVKVPVWNLLKLPDEVSYVQAAMLEPMSVAVHAMKSIDLKDNNRVAIYGLGTIGLFLLMFLKERGISDVIVIGNKDIQKDQALRFGVLEECFFDSRTGDATEWLECMNVDREIDVFFECVGRNEIVSEVVNYTGPGGKIVIIGNPASDMTLDKQTYWKILRNQLTIIGTWNSSYCQCNENDWQYVLDKLKNGRIHPEYMITHKFDFEDLLQGFELMRDKSEEYVKVLGVCNKL